MQPDYRFENHGSIFLVEPLNIQAEEHLAANVQDDAQWLGKRLVVEHRYAADLAFGLQNNGFVVS